MVSGGRPDASLSLFFFSFYLFSARKHGEGEKIAVAINRLAESHSGEEKLEERERKDFCNRLLSLMICALQVLKIMLSRIRLV